MVVCRGKEIPPGIASWESDLYKCVSLVAIGDHLTMKYCHDGSVMYAIVVPSPGRSLALLNSLEFLFQLNLPNSRSGNRANVKH